MKLYRLMSGLLIFTVACSADVDHDDSWGYEGDIGPDNWGQLSDDWVECSEGQEQSPIDLDDALTAEDVNDYDFVNPGTTVAIHNNGHTIQYDIDAGSTVTIGGTEYELLQFHFHARSEHTVAGAGYPLEVHLVHIDAGGNLAVLGVLIEEGPENELLAGAMWDQIPVEDLGTVLEEGTTFDPYELIPGGTVWTYDGSLTTPPCSEGVAWNVFSTPITMSSAQIDAYTAIYSNNYRPVQPLNGRNVLFGE